LATAKSYVGLSITIIYGVMTRRERKVNLTKL
jgi:hypothetical protein